MSAVQRTPSAAWTLILPTLLLCALDVRAQEEPPAMAPAPVEESPADEEDTAPPPDMAAVVDVPASAPPAPVNPEADQNPPPPIESVVGTDPPGGPMGMMPGMGAMMDPRLMLLRETFMGTAAGMVTLSGGLLVAVALAAVMPALVALPVGAALATQGSPAFDWRSFAGAAPALYAVLAMSFVPLIVVTGPAWDLVGFMFGSAFTSASPRASLVSSVIAGVVPALASAALFLAGSGAMVLLLGVASSVGRNVPGDPNGVIYGSLLIGTVGALALGVPLAILGSLAFRPLTYFVLRTLQDQAMATMGPQMGM